MRRRRSARRGFTLIELLCAAAALCILAGAAALAFGGADERRIVREEAEELRAWLSSRMAQAARDGDWFRMETNLYGSGVAVRLEWYRNSSEDVSRETYTPQRVDIGRVSLAQEYIFDGDWFTLTPAASFIIRSRKNPSIHVFVTVSGVGYASVSETLEEQ